VDGELDYSSCIQQRIAVWLATKKGERPIHPHFGCCIRDYMHTPLTIALVKEIRGKVERELKELFPETSVSMVKVEVPERNTIKVSAVVGDTSVTVTADGETLTKLNTQLRAAMRSLGMDYLR
jgi:phage baseplate assembly protein W